MERPAFAAGYSDPSTLDSSSIRIDYLPAQRVTIFGQIQRRAIAESISAAARQLTSTATSRTSKYGTQVLTLGSNQALTPRLTNEVRVNYSRVTGAWFLHARQFRRRYSSAGLRLISFVRLAAGFGFSLLC